MVIWVNSCRFSKQLKCNKWKSNFKQETSTNNEEKNGFKKYQNALAKTES